MQILLADHLGATGGIIGCYNLDPQFAQVDIALRQRLWMRDHPFNAAQLLSGQAEQAVIDRVLVFADDEQVMLAQQIIDIVDATGLRILYSHHTITDLTCGYRAEDLGEAAIWARLCQLLYATEVSAYRFVAERSVFALKGHRVGRSRRKFYPCRTVDFFLLIG